MLDQDNILNVGSVTSRGIPKIDKTTQMKCKIKIKWNIKWLNNRDPWSNGKCFNGDNILYKMHEILSKNKHQQQKRRYLI